MALARTARIDTDRFNRFIWAENERLNRLIRNLYLQFQLKHYTERELYDRICQEVAHYFHADSCELYLITHEEDCVPRDAAYPSVLAEPCRRLRRWLELVGAAGPWRRALHQQYVTQLSRARCQMPFQPAAPGVFRSSTRRALLEDTATRYMSTYEMPRRHDEQTGEIEKYIDSDLEEDVPRQVVWRNDSLYNSCRCIVSVPLIRAGTRNGARPTDASSLYHERIGVIKVENRTPFGVTGFLEEPQAGDNRRHLLMKKEWEVAALRPYIRELQHRADSGADPYQPLVNDVGWQQYFEDNPTGLYYYEHLLDALRLQRKTQAAGRTTPNALAQYTALECWLQALVETLVRVEAWLQHLRFACRLLCGLEEKPSLNHPVNSLFNVHNLRAAYEAELRGRLQLGLPQPNSPQWQRLSESIAPPVGAGESLVEVYDEFIRLFFQVLSGGNDAVARSVLDQVSLLLWLRFLERMLADCDCEETVRLAAQLLTGKLDRVCTNSKDSPAEARRSPLSACEDDAEVLRAALAHYLAAGSGTASQPKPTARMAAQKAREHQVLLAHTLDNNIEDLLSKRAATVSGILRSDTEFCSQEALVKGPPEWQFKKAIELGVLSDLQKLAETISLPGFRQSGKEYELDQELFEAQRMGEETLWTLECRLTPQLPAGAEPPAMPVASGTARAVNCAAHALAAATNFADSFNRVDESRLVFIAGHVAQVLDNHLLVQARQRKLPLDHDSLDLLGVDPFCLELLDRLQFHVSRLGPMLEHLLTRQNARFGDDALRFGEHTVPLGDVIESIGDHSTELTLTSQLLELRWTPNRTLGEFVRKEIFRHGKRLNEEVQSLQPEPNLSDLVFSPNASVLGECNEKRETVAGSESQLNSLQICLRFLEVQRPQVNGDEAADPKRDAKSATGDLPSQSPAEESVSVLLHLPRELLRRRDLRTLWVAERTLHGVARTLEAAAGGRPDDR